MSREKRETHTMSEEELQMLTETFTNDYVEDVAKERKQTPVFSGVLKYFPNALKEVAKCSQAGNVQHDNGDKLFWDRSKSGDELDALTRHLIDHSINPLDDDGQLHLAKVCWRALAGLEKYLEGQDI
tara:strand:- start:1025 stop:1405 length:381 start_codon:yes stop_codon:yes gene_type:complete